MRRHQKTNLATEKLKQCSEILFISFQDNGMKANADKCHFLVGTKVFRINDIANNNKFKIKINEINAESSPQVKLLGLILHDQLNFNSHMSNLCKKSEIECSCMYIFFCGFT